MTVQQSNSKMISHLFFKLLPVQAGLVAMGSVNAIIDGIVAGRFIDSSTLGVIGLYYTMLRVLEATSGLLLGGTAVVCGKYLGSGKVDKTRGICSMGLAAAFCFGAFLTAVSFLAPVQLSRILGANAQMVSPLSDCVRGYAVGIIPQLMGQELALMLQMERQDKRGEAGIASMIITNACLDVVFVAVMHMGVWGLSLATSVGNWVYFLIVAWYYFGKKAQLKPSIKLIDWKEFPHFAAVGFPNAFQVILLGARSLAVNWILLKYGDVEGLSALSSFNLSSGLILSLFLGTGAVVRILSSVFLGEENREGLLDMMKLLFTRMLVIAFVLSAAITLFSPAIAGAFFSDHSGSTYILARQLFFVYGFAMPFVYLCLVYFNYVQAAGFRKFVYVLSVCDGFLCFIIPSAVLAPVLGSFGVWLAFPIGMVAVCAIILGYIVKRNGHWPHSMSEWFLLSPDFGTREHLVLTIHDKSQLEDITGQIEKLCLSKGLSRKISMHAGLCMEELSLNIMQHGFHADRKRHSIEIRVLLMEREVVLRIKDDCIPFNPKEWYEMTSQPDPTAYIGIPIVYNLADEMNYQNLLGMNVLTIHLNNNPAHK